MAMELNWFKRKPEEPLARQIARCALGGTLIFAGITHMTIARKAFRAQVPKWVPEIVPVSKDQVVVWSGVAEISLGASILASGFIDETLAAWVGWFAGTFFIAIFPGNIAQWQHKRSAFGLDTDQKRFGRLFGQPLLVAWALWSTGAWANRNRLLGESQSVLLRSNQER